MGVTTELSLSGCDGSLSPLLSSVLGSSLVTAAVATAVDFGVGGCETCGDSVAVAPNTELDGAAGVADDASGFGCEFIELDVEGVVVVEEDIGELVLLIGVAIACCEVGGCIAGAPELLGDGCCCGCSGCCGCCGCCGGCCCGGCCCGG